jgi:aspartyl-tRNA(Asn)/glutamyl-tRNA(Gln) amidotransferase subunit B
VLATFPHPKKASNWIMTELLGYLNKHGLEMKDCKVRPQALGELLALVEAGTISGKIAKDIFPEMLASGQDATAIIAAKGLKQISDTGALEAVIDKVITENPKQLKQYRSGKDKLFGFFVGQVMKETQGQANPSLVNELLKKKLSG